MSTPQNTDKLLISRGGVSYSITYSDLNSDATQALTDAASAQLTADAALPKAGGTMTGPLTSTSDIDLTDSTVDLYSQTTTTTSKTFQLFSDVGGTQVEKTFIQADGTTYLGGSLGVGVSNPSYDVCIEGSSPILDLYNTDASSNDSHSVTIQSYGPVSTYWNKMALNASSIHLQTYGATRVSVTNDGLTFGGATGAANALDYYEEGSWTPVFKLGTTTASGTFEGHFTRIGRMVTASCSLQLSSTNSGTGENEVGGLPYTAAALYAGTTVQGGGTVTFFANGGNRERPTYAFNIFENSTAGAIYGGSNSASNHSDLDIRLSDNSFTNSSSIRIVFTYFV